MTTKKKQCNIPPSDEVFNLFSKLNGIPRPSWHEEKVADFLCDFAKGLDLEFKRDKQNCVVIKKPATAGYEKAVPITILNHCDMVCVAEKGKVFDPLKDPIVSYVDDGWLKARGTSLGADNGIGLSMALAVLQDDTIAHGPIEVLATTNEEDGMTGAANLATDFVTGKRIINLDSEDYDTITVGSAAAYLQSSRIPYHRTAVPDDYIFFRIEVKGGLGGHSGVDINKGRANANKIICQLLDGVNDAYGIIVNDINGGEAGNAIPASAFAVVGIPKARKSSFAGSIHDKFSALVSAYAETDKNLTCAIVPVGTPRDAMDKNTTDSLLRGICQIPSGVVQMSRTTPDTVETSNNTGIIRTEDECVFVSNYSRSFVDAEVLKLGCLIREALGQAGAETEVIMSSPAWQSVPGSPFIRKAEDVFADVLGFRPREVTMHFALEAGYYVQKFPGIEIVSIGPKIIEPHSVTERVNIQTVKDIWKVFVELLARSE